MTRYEWDQCVASRPASVAGGQGGPPPPPLLLHRLLGHHYRKAENPAKGRAAVGRFSPSLSHVQESQCGVRGGQAVRRISGGGALSRRISGTQSAWEGKSAPRRQSRRDALDAAGGAGR